MKLFKFLLFKLFKFLLFKLSVCLVPLELKSVENEKILESFYDFQSTEKCISLSKSRGESIQGVCVCNLQYCHQLNPKLPKVALNEALLFVTSRAGKRFDMDLLSIHEQGLLQNNQVEKVKIIPSIKHQSIIGFGGAFTDAAAINLYKLQSPLLRDQLLDSYFSKSGSEYSLGRVPIASTDFSESVYSYNDNPGDLSQSQFSIQVDKSKKIPMILAALSKSVTPIALFASSWAPPVWMTKENSTIDCIIDGDPGSPSDPLWQSYSLYLSNFFRDYLAQGIKFWAMTVQNEPVAQPKITGYIPGIHHFQSMRLTSDQEKLFIKNHLGPRMAQDHPYLKIIAFDDQKGQLDTHHAPLDDPEAAKYIAGFGIHWYSNTDFILGNGLKNVRNHFEKYPEKFILATEACEGFLPSLIGTGAGTALDDANKRWQRAENYARDIIGDLDSNVSGWVNISIFAII